jgi:FMN phosphatase YigB (HAD superfamily)
MIVFLFDNGGTLTDDPFAPALELLREERTLDDLAASGLPRAAQEQFLALWAEENDRFSFPFACHFLQEETWIVRALLRVAGPDGPVDSAVVPELAPRILRRYRTAVRAVLAAQPQHRAIAAIMAQLKAAGCAVAVASNDRAFATRAMMAWTGYAPHLDGVVTSEEMSSPHERVEKPAAAFFEKAIERLGAARIVADRVVYVGDSETNDVATPKAMGLTTVRYINQRNPKTRSWLDHTETTQADYCYRTVGEMPALFAAILRDRLIEKAVARPA